MANLKKINYKDIESWQPCYSPSRFLPTDWEGTALDIIKNDDIPWADRLWVVCREEVIDAKTLRLFAVFCARQVEHLLTDERSKNAIDVAERFANGLASKDELAAARDAAWDAADAAGYAARDAARAAARDAARYTAWDAVWDAARDAARYAAGYAARAAAEAAAGYVAWAAARDAVWDAAQKEQQKKLIEMLEGK